MIVDSLKLAARYYAANPRLKKAFEYLASVDPVAMPEGRYEIQGEEVYMMISERDLKPIDQEKPEAHDKYIDIQVVVSGQEGFGWLPREACTAPKGEMDPVKDILFYGDRSQTYFTLVPGQFAVFFPWDTHAPLLGEGKVKKAVIKVLV